jgi:hypothetical protein
VSTLLRLDAQMSFLTGSPIRRAYSLRKDIAEVPVGTQKLIASPGRIAPRRSSVS